MKSTIQTLNILVIGACFGPSIAAAQPTHATAFTFQGQLKHQSLPVNDDCDFEARLFGSESGNDPVSGPVDPLTVNNVEVVNGLFQIQLDFGAAVFSGADRWLDLRVKCDGLGENFTTLGPRQLVGAVPYAIHTRGINVPGIGNVGIGTTSPFATLHVRGGNGPSGGPYAGGTPLLVENNGSCYLGLSAPSSNESGILFGNSTSAADASLYYNNGVTPRGLQFRTDGSETRLSITQSGNIGIGTTSPDTKLRVAGGGIRIDGGQTISSAGRMHIQTDERLYLSPSAGDTYVGFGGGAGNLFVNGNVGIGMTNPARKLDVAGPIAVNGTEIINAQGQWVGSAGPNAELFASCSGSGVFICGSSTINYDGPALAPQADVEAYCAAVCTSGFASAQSGTATCTVSIAPNIGCSSTGMTAHRLQCGPPGCNPSGFPEPACKIAKEYPVCCACKN